jgi:hypothetical protein
MPFRAIAIAIYTTAMPTGTAPLHAGGCPLVDPPPLIRAGCLEMLRDCMVCTCEDCGARDATGLGTVWGPRKPP